MPTIDLRGRAALVLGGGVGVGRAIVDGLTSAGAETMVADTDPAALERVAARLSVETIECDFGVAGEKAAEPVAVTIERHGRLDILVCAQGDRPRSEPLPELSFEDYRRVQATNLDATFSSIQAASRAMSSREEGGRIVVVLGTNARGSRGGTAAHDMAQAGLRGLVRAAAVELAPQRITVNAVLAGWVRADAGEELPAGTSPPSPTGLVGEPEDVARAALWLLDPDNAFVTGSAIVVDGGQTAILP